MSRSNLEPVSWNNGDDISGACNLFGEMPESGWRSPSRALEVTIHRTYYPITEKVLHLVFDPFGEVEHVHMLGGLDHVLAQVVFKTKHAAAEAFGELHGRCVYTGCCQLDIKWGSSQNVSSHSTMTSSSPAMLQASTTSTVIEGHIPDSRLATAAIMATDVVPDITNIELHTTCSGLGFDVNVVFEDLTSEKLIVEDDATVGHAEVLATAVTCDDINIAVQSMVILNTMDCDAADELQVLAVPMVAKDVMPVPNLTVTIWSSTNASLASLVHDNSDALHAFGETHQGKSQVNINSLNMVGTTKTILASKCGIGTALNLFNRDNMSGDVLVLWALSKRSTEWQPWPPQMQSGISCDSTAMRPMPWPSFSVVPEISDESCYSFPWKPPWPLSQFCIFLMVLIASCADLLNNYKIIEAPTSWDDFCAAMTVFSGSLQVGVPIPSSGLEMLVNPPSKYFSAYNVKSYELLRGFVHLDMHAVSTVVLWPMRMKPPWPLLAPHIFSITIETIQLWEFLILHTILLISTQARTILDSQWCMHMLDSDSQPSDPQNIILCIANTSCPLKGNTELLSFWELLTRNKRELALLIYWNYGATLFGFKDDNLFESMVYNTKHSYLFLVLGKIDGENTLGFSMCGCQYRARPVMCCQPFPKVDVVISQELTIAMGSKGKAYAISEQQFI